MELNYKKLGEEGPVIIILHGLFGMLDNWKTIARKMSDDYQVYIVDQRDHGKSPKTDDFNYKLLATDLMEFIEQLQLSPLAVIGHSMGGKSTMQFLNDYPGNIEKAVIVDIGPLENKAGHGRIFEALFAVNPSEIKTRTEAFEILSEYLDDEGVIQFLMKNLNRDPKEGYRWKMNLELLHTQYQEVLNSIEFDYPISTPTLFIKGAKSDYLNEENIDTITDAFVDTEVVEIADSGHWVHADNPEALMDSVYSFLKE